MNKHIYSIKNMFSSAPQSTTLVLKNYSPVTKSRQRSSRSSTKSPRRSLYSRVKVFDNLNNNNNNLFKSSTKASSSSSEEEAEEEEEEEERIRTMKEKNVHRSFNRRNSLLLLTAGCLATAATSAASAPRPAIASATEEVSTAEDPSQRRVYFGNGCFWGRQHEFVLAEKEVMGRSDDRVQSLAGYAGGKRGGSGAKKDTVCYYYGSSDTVYERLGHAEVVQVEYETEDEFKTFADVYFRNFNKTPFGMQRVDPQDSGPGYRNVVGIPGGIENERLVKQLELANVNGMKLVKGEGNDFDARGKPTENDQINLVWIVDSNALPFYPAEMYHQFHDGLGYKFPDSYTLGLKKVAAKRGLIKKLPGCPEMRERSFADFESMES